MTREIKLKKKLPVYLVDEGPGFREALNAVLMSPQKEGPRAGSWAFHFGITLSGKDYLEKPRLTEIMVEAAAAKTYHAMEERRRRLRRSGAPKLDPQTIDDDELRLLAVKLIRAGLSFHSIKGIVDRAIKRGRKTAADLFVSVGRAAAAARKKNIKPLVGDEIDYWLLCFWDGTVGHLPSKLPPLQRWSVPAVHKYFAHKKIGRPPIELDALRKRFARLGLKPIQPILVNTASAKVAIAQLPKSQARVSGNFRIKI